jgi:hypothetical protein
MYDRLQKHSKNENDIFAGDFFKEEPLQLNFSRLVILHAKLNSIFIRHLGY